MLEEAITLIEKQIDMYKIQKNNIEVKPYSRNTPNKVKKRLERQIQIWEYIFKKLNKEKTLKKKQNMI